MATVTGKWMASLPAAKALAQTNGSVLLVVSCDSRTCSHCKAAEAQVWDTPAWHSYAVANGIPQFLADGRPTATRKIRDALHKVYNAPFWPTVFVFAVSKVADVTTARLGLKDVALLTKFVYRKGKTVHGVKVNLTPADFIAILEACCQESAT